MKYAFLPLLQIDNDESGGLFQHRLSLRKGNLIFERVSKPQRGKFASDREISRNALAENIKQNHPSALRSVPLSDRLQKRGNRPVKHSRGVHDPQGARSRQIPAGNPEIIFSRIRQNRGKRLFFDFRERLKTVLRADIRLLFNGDTHGLLRLRNADFQPLLHCAEGSETKECQQQPDHIRSQSSTRRESLIFLTCSTAFSTDSARARSTPRRRCPLSSPFPKIRMEVSGAARTLSSPLNET